MSWRYQQYGSISDPVHKSHLNELTGEYGCARRYRYQRDAALDAPSEASEPSQRVSSALACGSAVHETIARALSSEEVRARLLTSGEAPVITRIRDVFERELAAAADGRLVEWPRDSNADSTINDCVLMVHGVLLDLPKYVRSVLAVEPGFIVQLEGVWYSGHVDLIFEPRDEPGSIGIADWKTSKSKPDSIELAHGWEGGIYSLACAQGDFLARELVQLTPSDDPEVPGWIASASFMGSERDEHVTLQRESRWQAERDCLEAALQYWAGARALASPKHMRFNRYPMRVYHVHLRDYVPYAKATTKEAKRPEDLAYYGLTHAQSVKCKPGDRRGPAWLPVELHENDIQRLAYRAKQVIGTVRMGRFADSVREHCKRCAFSKDCLTGGYAPRGDELAELEHTLRKAGL